MKMTEVQFQKNIKSIYNRLGDDLSKEIFTYRLLYSLTGNIEYVLHIVRMTEEGDQIYSRLKEEKKRKVIFGAGIWGKNIINAYQDMKFGCFIDNKAFGTYYCGLPVISFEEYLKKYRNELVVISSRLYHVEIHEQLRKEGVTEENIIDAGMLIDNMSKKQYFDLPQLQDKKSDSEVFIDGGSFDGKTSVAFMNWCGGKYKKIYVFEPDSENQIKCENTLLQYKSKGGVEIIFKGLWDNKTTLRFTAISNGSSKVDEDGIQQIDVVSLDEMIHNTVTFIKLDVEGSEYKALLGARRIIRDNKPKLAISVYHKPEDIWELPELIKSLNPDYSFYLRHYSIAASETVLYAV